MKTLEEFICEALSWDFLKRQAFVRWLLTHIETLRLDWTSAVPDPLSRKIIKPTLNDWSHSMPPEALPYRWLGIWGDKSDLHRALEIDPDDQLARKSLLRGHLLSLWQSLDHMNEDVPWYSGNPESDLLLVDDALEVLSQHPNPQGFDMLREKFEDIRSVIMDFLEFKRSGEKNFRDWCHQKALHHEEWFE